MGITLFKKTTYPARRNRINEHPASVIPPSSYGAQNPTPIPASVYQANGVAAAPAHTAAAASIAPSSNASAATTAAIAPVQATVYVPGQGGAAPGGVAPVVATAYVPGSAAVSAEVYNPNRPNGNVASIPPASAYPSAATAGATIASIPPACAYGQTTNNTRPQATTNSNNPPGLNPMYQAQRPSINNGNSNFKSDESTFWECVVCTFPNLRTEANCKGCGSSIPPGMLYSPASAAAAHAQQTNYNHTQTNNQGYGGNYNNVPQNPQMGGVSSQMNNLSLGGAGAGAGSSAGGGVMRVHIPNGMRPGQRIKVRSPDGNEVVKTIPPQSEWHYDGSKPFFRMQFGSPAPATTPSTTSSSLEAHEIPPPHSTSWRDFHSRAPSHYTAPPLGTKTVPHSPRGMGSGLPPNGRHKSLIIGINYHRTRAELRGCINDAKNMQTLLQRNGYPNDGSHMLLLTDEKSRGSTYQPTVKNIMKAFAWFMKDVRKGDVLFFHFSGHGGQVPDKTGHEEDGWNETIIPLDFERNGQITDDVLWGSLVYNLPQGARITALMDMCHSGTGLDLPYDYNVDTRQWKEDMNPAHSAGDVVLFSGCEDSQTSADVGGGYGKQAGGAMTQAFTKAYEETNMSMSTYHEFLYAIKKQLKRKNFKQRPQLTSSQQFDASSRIFSLGYCSPSGGVPSMIEPNHNPKVGRMKRRHVRPGRQGFGGGGGGGDIFGMAAAAVGAALVMDALF